MKKRTYIALIVVTGLLLAPANVMALSVIDLDPGDLNVIVDQDPPPGAPPEPVHRVFEEYGETGLVPYPSHDGMAVIQPDVPPSEMWFDKIVEYSEEDLAVGPIKDVIFDVINFTPYIWSDYHIEFWDATFDLPLEIGPALSGWGNVIFSESFFDGSVLEFFAPDLQHLGEANSIVLTLDMGILVSGGFPGGHPLDPDETGSFGIRQVATTRVIPEPLTMAGVFLGIAGLTRYVKRRKV